MKTKLIAGAVAIAMALPVVVKWEGTRNVAYLDHLGIPTICTGHTGPEVKLGLRVSDEQCAAWLKQDLQAAYDTTQRCVPGYVPQSVRAAYTSFTFNVGPGRAGVKDGMCVLRSGRTPLHIRQLQAAQWREACDTLMLWANAGGVASNGVRNRRVDEVKLCYRDIQ